MTAEVRRLVPADQYDAAMALLDGVDYLGWDVVWLRLAALHLSAGRVDLLPQWIQLANADPRDLKTATLSHLDPMWDARFQWPAEISLSHGR